MSMTAEILWPQSCNLYCSSKKYFINLEYNLTNLRVYMLIGFSGISYSISLGLEGFYLYTLYSLNAPSFTTGNLHNRSFQEEPKRFLTGTKMPKIPLAVTFLERRSTVKAQTLLRTFTSNSYFNISNSNNFVCLFGKSLLRSWPSV